MSKTPSVFNVVREGDIHIFEFVSDNLDPAAIEAASDEIPRLINLPTGCGFQTRGPLAKRLCRSEDRIVADNGGRWVAGNFRLTR